MFRFIIYAVPLLILELALFGFAVELLEVEPRPGSVIKLALLEQPRVPGQVVFGTWLVESAGLIALFLLAQKRFATWWLDGLVAGWVGWLFRGPLLVVTIVVAARQPQDPWWTLAFGWWGLYSVCGLSLAVLARRSGFGYPLPEAAGASPGKTTTPVPAVATDSAQEEAASEPVEDKAPSELVEDKAPAEPMEDEVLPIPETAETASGHEAAEATPEPDGVPTRPEAADPRPEHAEPTAHEEVVPPR